MHIATLLTFGLFHCWLGADLPEGATLLQVSPSSLSSAAQQIRGPHLVYTPALTKRLPVVVTLGGTNSLPSDWSDFHRVALALNYRVIALDYPNEVISTQCALQPRESDPACFDQYREEIAFGNPVSSQVEVSTENSIHHRLTRLLRHLSQLDPSWSHFLIHPPGSTESTVNWDRILLVGHSQGAGHVAFLAKRFAVHKAIMVGGPQEGWSPDQLAPWLSQNGRTPLERQFAILHDKDAFFTSGLQPSVQQMLFRADKKLLARQVIIERLPVANGHMDLLKPLFAKTWKTLLTSE